MARKRKAKPSSQKRNGKQSTASRYRRAREDAQLEGLLPTTPEDALKPERVDPALQDEQRFPGLDRKAILEADGWGVNEHVRRQIVARNAEPLFEKPQVIVMDGRPVEIPVPRKVIQESSKILQLADEMDYKRRNPKEAGQAAGGGGEHAVIHKFDWSLPEPPASGPVLEGTTGEDNGNGQVHGRRLDGPGTED